MRIAAIALDEHSVLARSAAVENERAAAIADLLRDGWLAPESGLVGPFALHLAVEENRLRLEIRSPSAGAAETIMLPLAPFRRLVKDYFLVCESYYRAIRDRGVAQIEAIDAGRRALHDDGAALLSERLAGKMAIDHATARRLFTLLCVLHLRGWGAGGAGELT
jgi:uncharacterized protein (UPF0262 family)